jgi:hypothetical protein
LNGPPSFREAEQLQAFNTHRWLVALGLSVLLAGCFESDPSAKAVNAPPVGASGSSNRSPSISGQPPTAVKAGETYNFRPSASDPDNDPLSFSIRNKPNWLAFDSSTGRLSGVPGDGDVGSYEDIVIAVSDGRAAAELPVFVVDVTQVAMGSVTLSWTPPSENTDGSPLTNLAGYKIYFGKSQNSLDQVVTIDSPGVTTYVIENLSPSTYYFAMSSLNASGVESERSQTLSKTIA